MLKVSDMLAQLLSMPARRPRTARLSQAIEDTTMQNDGDWPCGVTVVTARYESPCFFRRLKVDRAALWRIDCEKDFDGLRTGRLHSDWRGGCFHAVL